MNPHLLAKYMLDETVWQNLHRISVCMSTWLYAYYIFNIFYNIAQYLTISYDCVFALLLLVCLIVIKI